LNDAGTAKDCGVVAAGGGGSAGDAGAGGGVQRSAGGGPARAMSGGCLEAEVVRKAAWMTRAGAVVERYSTLFDDTAEIPYGLGCGGTVDLLVEPAGTPEFELLMEALEASLRGEARRVVTSLPEGGLPLRRAVGESAAEGIEGMEEWIEAPLRMYVFGAGDDAQPLVQMAGLMGWDATVVDGRKQWARPERFPEAVRVIAAETFEGLAGVEIGAGDVAVVMTHSYEQDRVWMAGLLEMGLRYLGLLGARHRSALIVSETAAALGWSVERACAGLFAPVGLDLGGDGAVAIALAVVAEIQACCEGKLGVSQRMTPEMVAEQVAKGGASRYLQAQCSL
jgi:xanthine dehydrogenase accessory factor